MGSVTRFLTFATRCGNYHFWNKLTVPKAFHKGFIENSNADANRNRALFSSMKAFEFGNSKGSSENPKFYSSDSNDKSKVSEFEKMVFEIHFIRIEDLGYKLKLAALYNQATIGECNEPEPDKDDHYEHSYWTAWKQLGNMSKKDAEKEYCVEANKRIASAKRTKTDIIIND